MPTGTLADGFTLQAMPCCCGETPAAVLALSGRGPERVFFIEFDLRLDISEHDWMKNGD